MATRTVTFRREYNGNAINIWIYHPDPATGQLTNVTEKLIFTDNYASSVLDDSAQYLLFWVAVGPAGSKLKVERRIEGVDAAFKVLDEKVKEWKIPPKPGQPHGAVLTRQDSVKFKLQGT